MNVGKDMTNEVQADHNLQTFRDTNVGGNVDNRINILNWNN